MFFLLLRTKIWDMLDFFFFLTPIFDPLENLHKTSRIHLPLNSLLPTKCIQDSMSHWSDCNGLLLSAMTLPPTPYFSHGRQSCSWERLNQITTVFSSKLSNSFPPQDKIQSPDHHLQDLKNTVPSISLSPIFDKVSSLLTCLRLFWSWGFCAYFFLCLECFSPRYLMVCSWTSFQS